MHDVHVYIGGYNVENVRPYENDANIQNFETEILDYLNEAH